ncbi:unnamed protein product [Sympodiomycopsis kandeliae]
MDTSPGAPHLSQISHHSNHHHPHPPPRQQHHPDHQHHPHHQDSRAYPSSNPDRSPVESRMAVTDGWHHRMDPHRPGPQHGYPPSEWNGHPSHHHPHFLPPPPEPQPQHGHWRSARPDHPDPPYHHAAHPHHHANGPQHQRPTVSPPQHRHHSKSASRDNFLPPPLPPTMGPPSDRAPSPIGYDHTHPAKARGPKGNRNFTPEPIGPPYENGGPEWGHKRKRSEAHEQYGPMDRAAWGGPHYAAHSHPQHYHPDASPSWGKPPPQVYDSDYNRMQPPAPKKTASHNRNRSIDEPRSRKTTQPPPSPGHRNGMHSIGSPHDQPPRLPRAATEEVRNHAHPIAAPAKPGVRRMTPPEIMDGYYGPPGPAPLPQHAASQPPPAVRTVKEEKQHRSAEIRRQKDAAKREEMMQREHERQQREQQQQRHHAQQQEAEMRRAGANTMPPRGPTPPPPQASGLQHPPTHFEAGAVYGPHGYGPQPPLPGPMDYNAAPAAHHGQLEQPHIHHAPVHPTKDAYLEQQQHQVAAAAGGQLGEPLHLQHQQAQFQQAPMQQARITSEPVWQWFDELSTRRPDHSADGAEDDNRRVGTWSYASHKQPLLPGDVLAGNLGGLVEVRISGQELGAYREISDSRAQVGWTLGWRARHHGARVDVASASMSAALGAEKFKPDPETILTLSRRKLWGSEVYTDDSDVLSMCIHSGWIEFPSAASGESRPEHNDIQMYSPPDLKVLLRIAPRLTSYQESFGGGLWSRNWYGRHDGSSLVVETVELKPSGYAMPSCLPGKKGTKRRVSQFALESAKALALAKLDGLSKAKAVAPRHESSVVVEEGNDDDSEIIPVLDNRKQSAFPLSDLRRGGEDANVTTTAKKSKNMNMGHWWRSTDLILNRLNGSAAGAAIVTQKA